MEKLIEVIQDERTKIGLIQDSLNASWADLAHNQGTDTIVITDYLFHLIQKSALTPSKVGK